MFVLMFSAHANTFVVFDLVEIIIIIKQNWREKTEAKKNERNEAAHRMEERKKETERSHAHEHTTQLDNATIPS